MIRKIGLPFPEPSELLLGPIDAAEIVAAQERADAFGRNIDWYQQHALEIGEKHGGKHICVSDQELFVGESTSEVLTLATAAHPDDKAPFFKYVYPEKAIRIYAHRWSMAHVRRRR